MSNVRNDYYRHYRMERLCARAEQGYGEDGPVVNVRHDGVMVLVEYANYWQMDINAASAASRCMHRINDPLPKESGTVLAASARIKADKAPDSWAGLFGTSATEIVRNAYVAAREVKRSDSNHNYYQWPSDLRACGNARLNALLSKYSGEWAYSSDAEQAELATRIEQIKAEITRRYLSIPIRMVI